jgi:hypothetical protein
MLKGERKVTMIGKLVMPCVLAVVSTCQVLAQEAKPNPLECDEFGVIRQGRYTFFGGEVSCDNKFVFSDMHLFCMVPDGRGGAVLTYLGITHEDHRDRNGQVLVQQFSPGNSKPPYPVRYIQKTRIEGNRIRRDVGHQGKWDPVPKTYQYDIILQKSSFGAISECLIDGKLVKLPAEPGEELLAGNVKKIQINPKDPERNFTLECDRGMRIKDMRKTWPQGTFKIEIPLEKEAEQAMVAIYFMLPDAARTRLLPKPAIRRSQVGYPAHGQKYVGLEYAPNVDRPNDDTVKLERRGTDTNTVVMTGRWGESFRYLAYQLAEFDFSAVTQTGDYRVVWSGGVTDWFPIYERSMAAEPSPQAAEKKRLNVLWYGNSFTGCGDLQSVVRKMAEAGDPALVLGGSGCVNSGSLGSLAGHWKAGSQKSITPPPGSKQKWDFVVLQSYNDDMEGEKSLYAQYAPKYAELIKAQGGRVVLYETTPTTQNSQRLTVPPDPAPVIEKAKAIAALAKQTDALVVPMSMVALRCQTVRPDLTLRYANDFHPNQTMTYLTACTFYAALFNRSPEGLPALFRSPEGLPIDTIPSPPGNKDPDGWPSERTFSRQDRADLQRIAWEGLQQFQQIAASTDAR